MRKKNVEKDAQVDDLVTSEINVILHSPIFDKKMMNESNEK